MAKKDFHKEMSSYLSKKSKKSLFSFKKVDDVVYDADELSEEDKQLASISDTKTTIIEGNDSVFDTVKKSVTSFLKKKDDDDVPAFDEKGNVLDNEHKEYEQATSPFRKSGKFVGTLVSKLDVFDVLGKKTDATAKAEYAELEEFGEMLETSKDIKELARISANVLRLLPADKLEEFKRGPDFKHYKLILKRNRIIK